MIKDIVKDIKFLQIKCKSISKTTPPEEVKQLIQDLRDTAEAYEESHNCVGLAANQIGSNLRMIIVRIYGKWQVMINPVISMKGNLTHVSEEGCLSLDGTRYVKRYNIITVLYKTESGMQRKRPCRGLVADIVQHEIDHLNGKLI